MARTNIPLEIKRVFLSFAQQYFATEHPTLIWNVDPRKTKIFIGDKYALNPAVVESMPSIVISRGTMTYAQSSIGQLQSQDNITATDATKRRTDLVRCNITIQCTSKNGVEAEMIANILFANLVGYKDQLRENGIHQILGVSMGEETPVRGDIEPRLLSVPLNVMFTVQSTIVTTHDMYDLQVLTDTEFTPMVLGDVGSWYSYTVSGAYMLFSYPPTSGASLKASFKGKYTLGQYTNVTPTPVPDGANTMFMLPEEQLCFYETYWHELTYVSGVIE